MGEQLDFLEGLYEIADVKVYKWLRFSFKYLNKKVFDLYLEELLKAHNDESIGHNDFCEWIIDIPKKVFYKKRLVEFIKYLSELDIKHKTYKYKIDRAINHLS